MAGFRARLLLFSRLLDRSGALVHCCFGGLRLARNAEPGPGPNRDRETLRTGSPTRPHATPMSVNGSKCAWPPICPPTRPPFPPSIPGTWHQVRSTWYQVPSSRYMAPGVCSELPPECSKVPLSSARVFHKAATYDGPGSLYWGLVPQSSATGCHRTHWYA